MTLPFQDRLPSWARHFDDRTLQIASRLASALGYIAAGMLMRPDGLLWPVTFLSASAFVFLVAIAGRAVINRRIARLARACRTDLPEGVKDRRS